MDGFDKTVIALWAVGLLFAAGFWGVVIWAIIKLVGAVT